MYRLLLPLIILSAAAGADSAPQPTLAKLFLTSGAIYVLSDLVPFLPQQKKESIDYYIVTAGNVHDNPHWITDEVNAVIGIGRAVRPIDLARLSRDELEATFHQCAIVWVGSGNPFYLLQEARRTGFDELLARKIAAGTPYIGTSAGSIILAPDIESVRFANDLAQAPELASFEGLGLFPLFAFAHFDSPDFKSFFPGNPGLCAGA